MAKKVLVCEDNPVNRVLMHDLLAIDGHEVIEAADGPRASSSRPPIRRISSSWTFRCPS